MSPNHTPMRHNPYPLSLIVRNTHFVRQKFGRCLSTLPKSTLATPLIIHPLTLPMSPLSPQHFRVDHTLILGQSSAIQFNLLGNSIDRRINCYSLSGPVIKVTKTMIECVIIVTMVTAGGHSFTIPACKPHPLNSPGDLEDLLPPEEHNDGHSCGYPHWCIGKERG